MTPTLDGNCLKPSPTYPVFILSSVFHPDSDNASKKSPSSFFNKTKREIKYKPAVISTYVTNILVTDKYAYAAKIARATT